MEDDEPKPKVTHGLFKGISKDLFTGSIGLHLHAESRKHLFSANKTFRAMMPEFYHTNPNNVYLTDYYDADTDHSELPERIWRMYPRATVHMNGNTWIDPFQKWNEANPLPGGVQRVVVPFIYCHFDSSFDAYMQEILRQFDAYACPHPTILFEFARLARRRIQDTQNPPSNDQLEMINSIKELVQRYCDNSNNKDSILNLLLYAWNSMPPPIPVVADAIEYSLFPNIIIKYWTLIHNADHSSDVMMTEQEVRACAQAVKKGYIFSIGGGGPICDLTHRDLLLLSEAVPQTKSPRDIYLQKLCNGAIPDSNHGFTQALLRRLSLTTNEHVLKQMWGLVFFYVLQKCRYPMSTGEAMVLQPDDAKSMKAVTPTGFVNIFVVQPNQGFVPISDEQFKGILNLETLYTSATTYKYFWVRRQLLEFMQGFVSIATKHPLRAPASSLEAIRYALGKVIPYIVAKIDAIKGEHPRSTRTNAAEILPWQQAVDSAKAFLEQ